jgi:hypothetical protein
MPTSFDRSLTRPCRDHYAFYNCTFVLHDGSFRILTAVLSANLQRVPLLRPTTHLRPQHKSHLDVRPRSGAKEAAYVAQRLCKAFPGAADPTKTRIQEPAPSSPPISRLSLCRGLKCSVSEDYQSIASCKGHAFRKTQFGRYGIYFITYFIQATHFQLTP